MSLPSRQCEFILQWLLDLLVSFIGQKCLKASSWLFSKENKRLWSKSTEWLQLRSVSHIFIRSKGLVKSKARLCCYSQKRTHCSCAHQTDLHSHYLHHTSSAVGYTDDCHNGNLQKDCKSSPLQQKMFANKTWDQHILV